MIWRLTYFKDSQKEFQSQRLFVDKMTPTGVSFYRRQIPSVSRMSCRWKKNKEKKKVIYKEGKDEKEEEIE